MAYRTSETYYDKLVHVFVLTETFSHFLKKYFWCVKFYALDMSKLFAV